MFKAKHYLSKLGSKCDCLSLCSIRIPKQNFKYQMNSTYMHNAHFFRPFVLSESKNSNFFSITIYKECSLNPSNLFDHELAVI